MSHRIFSISGGGSGSGGNAFGVVQPITGTSPTADSASDTLILTSSDSSMSIVGTAATDTLDYKLLMALSSAGGFGFDLSSVLVNSSAGSLASITPTSAIIKFTNSGGSLVTINGFVPPTSGNYSVLFLINDRTGSNQTIILTHEAGSVTASNRINLSSGVSMTIPVGGVVILVYDTNDSRWKANSTPIAPGSNGQVIFNSSGVLGADSDLTWSTANNLLTSTSGYTTGGGFFTNASVGQAGVMILNDGVVFGANHSPFSNSSGYYGSALKIHTNFDEDAPGPIYWSYHTIDEEILHVMSVDVYGRIAFGSGNTPSGPDSSAFSIRSRDTNFVACSVLGVPSQTANLHNWSGSTSTSCGVFGDQSSCEAQSPCVWLSVDCGSYVSEASCNGDANCSWDGAIECSAFMSEGSCTAIPGCTWEDEMCSGTGTYCNGGVYDTCSGTYTEVQLKTKVDSIGNFGVQMGSTALTAKLHIAAGSTAASTAPLKFVTGALNSVSEIGAMEFLVDDLHFTQTTNTSRHPVAWQDNPIPQQVFS